MGGDLVLLHIAIAVVGIVVLIVWVRLNPIIVLVLGSLYLGLATGLGFDRTAETVSTGFGELMGEVGLIIGFGVLIGTILQTLGALQRTVELLVRIVGGRGSGQALGLSLAVIFPSIYFDVALVMSAPIARSVARRSGRGIAELGGALAIGLEVGLLMVLPGAAALAVAASVGVPLGTMLLFGLLVGVPATVLTILLHGWVVRRLWRPELDEERAEEAETEVEYEAVAAGSTGDQGPGTTAGAGGEPPEAEAEAGGATPDERRGPGGPPLPVLLAPVLVPLVLILLGTAEELAGWGVGVLAFLADPVVALLVGLLIGVGLALRTMTRDELEELFESGANRCGTLLLFTGVAGSLGAVIAESGVRDIVAELFASTPVTPLLLVWVVAALLRLAQGSATVAAVTAGGLVAAVATALGYGPPMLALVALAAAAGAAFGGHVSDNSFWIFRSLLGLTTRGTFKAYTLAQSMLSVVALGLVLAVSAVV